MKHTSYTCDLCGNKATKVNGHRSAVTTKTIPEAVTLCISATIEIGPPELSSTVGFFNPIKPEHVCLPCIIKALTGVSDE
jgi:hypothetical protein